MGFKYNEEFSSKVAPKRMFKALILESHIHIPKIVPDGIKSIEYVEGDGGVGSIEQTNFPEGGHLKTLKHKKDAIDVENFYCKYTLTEGDVIFDKIESVEYEIKFKATNDGCICKMTSDYHTKAGVELNEEDVKKGKDKAIGLFKVVADYLINHPCLSGLLI